MLALRELMLESCDRGLICHRETLGAARIGIQQRDDPDPGVTLDEGRRDPGRQQRAALGEATQRVGTDFAGAHHLARQGAQFRHVIGVQFAHPGVAQLLARVAQ